MRRKSEKRKGINKKRGRGLCIKTSVYYNNKNKVWTLKWVYYTLYYTSNAIIETSERWFNFEP